MSDLTSIDTIIEKLSAYKSTSLKSDAQTRKEALGLSRQLTAQLSNPANSAIETIFRPLIPLAIRLAVDLKVFDKIVESKEPITTAQLAEASGAEPLLMNRIVRILAGEGLVLEVSKDLWGSMPLTVAMTVPAMAAGQRLSFDILLDAAVKAPKYLRETQYRCPTEPKDGFLQYARQTKYSSFELLSTMPSALQDFNLFMGSTMGTRQYWYDWFPIQDRILSGLDETKALLVDVGGGKGHDMEAFHAKYPGQGRLVLQDLKQGLSSITTLAPAIEIQEHDFFTEQPEKVKYFQFLNLRAFNNIHQVHYCLQILKHIRNAMTPGYSKLLIHELILPDVGATPFQTTYDLVMLLFNAGAERSRNQWIELLAKADLQVERLWVENNEWDGIVEVLRKE